MKEIIAMLYASILLFNLSACGKNTETPTPSALITAVTEAVTDAVANAAPDAAETGKPAAQSGSQPATTTKPSSKPSAQPVQTPTPAAAPTQSVPATQKPVTQPTQTTEPKVTAKPETQPTQKTASTPAPTPAPIPAPTEHVHDWQPVYQTVHHDAETTQQYVVDVPATSTVVHHDGYYECLVCGFTAGSSDVIGAHSFDTGHNYHRVPTWDETVWCEEKGHTETVVVREAYDEQVLTGYTCACGAIKGA